MGLVANNGWSTFACVHQMSKCCVKGLKIKISVSTSSRLPSPFCSAGSPRISASTLRSQQLPDKPLSLAPCIEMFLHIRDGMN